MKIQIILIVAVFIVSICFLIISLKRKIIEFKNRKNITNTSTLEKQYLDGIKMALSTIFPNNKHTGQIKSAYNNPKAMRELTRQIINDGFNWQEYERWKELAHRISPDGYWGGYKEPDFAKAEILLGAIYTAINKTKSIFGVINQLHLLDENERTDVVKINYLSYGNPTDPYMIMECEKIQTKINKNEVNIFDLIKPLVLNGSSEWMEILPVDLDLIDSELDMRNNEDFKNQGGKVLFTLKIPSELFFNGTFLTPTT